jgi:hypothetical protein
MIPSADLKALDEFLEGIETPGVRLICARCSAELPGSDPAGHRVSYGYCSSYCRPRIQKEDSLPGPVELPIGIFFDFDGSIPVRDPYQAVSNALLPVGTVPFVRK